MNIPEYTVELWDIHGQYVLDISRFIAFNLDLKLNDSDVITFVIDHEQFTRLCASVNLYPRNVLYPKKTEVLVRRNGVILTGGSVSIVNTAKADDGTKTLNVTVDGYEKYFANRFSSRTWSSTDRSQIAWDAINDAQNVTNGDYGLVRGVHTNTYASDLTADLMAVKDIIQQYTFAQPVTYDYDITPSVVNGKIVKTFNTYLEKGSLRNNIELVDPQNISTLNVRRSGDTLANKIIGIGSGIGSERLQSIQENENSQATYLVQEKKQLFNSVINQTVLDNNTSGVLENSHGVLVTFDCVLEPGTLDLSVVGLGDSVRCRVDNDIYNDDINGIYRIYEIKVSVDLDRNEVITPSLYNPGLGGEIATD